MKKCQIRILTVYWKIILELGPQGSLFVVPTVVNFYVIHLFEAGYRYLLTFRPYRMGAYSRRVLIWGWVVNWINTVIMMQHLKPTDKLLEIYQLNYTIEVVLGAK